MQLNLFTQSSMKMTDSHSFNSILNQPTRYQARTPSSHTHTQTHTLSLAHMMNHHCRFLSHHSLWSLLSDFLLTANHEASDQTLRSESTSGQRERWSEWRWRVIYWEILGFLELLKTETNWIHKNQMMIIWLWCNNNTQKLTFMYSWVSLKHISPHN